MDGVFNPLSVMMGQQQDQGPMNSVAGAAPPPTGQPQFDIIGTVQRLLQMPQFQEPSQQLSDIGAREKGVSQQMEEMSKPENMPQRRYEPGYEHGAGVGGALRNVGRGVLQGLSFTGPGQAVSDRIYEPGVKAYEQKKEALAGELASMKGEEETAKEKMSAATGITGAASLGAYRSGQLGLGQEKVEVSRQRADLKAQEISNNYKVQLQRLEQGSQRLSIQERQQQTREWYYKGLLDAYQARIDSGMTIAEAHNASQEDMKAAAQESAYRKEHWFQNMIGLIPEGASVSAPGAGQPKPTAVQKPGAKTAAPPAGATHIGMGPDGKRHYADAKGTDLGPVR